MKDKYLMNGRFFTSVSMLVDAASMANKHNPQQMWAGVNFLCPCGGGVVSVRDDMVVVEYPNHPIIKNKARYKLTC